jgi:S1-C subfamily serine protease
MDPIDQIDPTTQSSPLDPLTPAGEAHQPYRTATTGPNVVPVPVTRSRRRVSGPMALFGAVLLSAVLGSAGTFGLLAASGTLPAASTAVAPSAASIVQAVASAAPATTDGSVIETVAAAVSPAVVTITTVGVARGDSGVGSGVIVDARGWILTNNHVVADSSSMTVTLADGRTFDGTVAATDATHDLAIVKVDATGLPTAVLGDSTALQVGQLVVAIGSPLGTYTGSVTSGIVSALGRSITIERESLTDLIQTDAAINPGIILFPLVYSYVMVLGL